MSDERNLPITERPNYPDTCVVTTAEVLELVASRARIAKLEARIEGLREALKQYERMGGNYGDVAREALARHKGTK